MPTAAAMRAGKKGGHFNWTSVLSKCLITCAYYRSSVVAAILGLSPSSLNLRISPGAAQKGAESSGSESVLADVGPCLALLLSSLIGQ